MIQKCKPQNTRLVDYFRRVDVLKRLLGYMTGQIEGGENEDSPSTQMLLRKLLAVKYGR